MNQHVQFELHPSMSGGAAGETAPIYSDLETAVRLDLRHHYSGPICARRWLSLCNSPQYGHKTLARVIQSEIPNALCALKDTVRARRVDLVSLGPGNGDIDRRFLRRLQQDFDSLGYICIDRSFELLQFATASILREPALRKLRMPIRAIWGDFTRMDPLPQIPAEHSARLFCLTGFTFGNHNESFLMDAVGRAFAPGDFLFLDARLHHLTRVNGNLTDRQIGSLVNTYALDLCNRFVFGPVELVTTSTAGDVAFGYDVNRSITAVPNAVNVLIYCKDLHTRMRFTGKTVDIPRLNLASVTLYNYSDLVQWFFSRNFEVTWHAQNSGIGLFLLRAGSR